MSKSLKHKITFKVLGKEQNTFNDQLTEALKREDYETCAKLQMQMQEEKIKDLLR